jgi:hypothetical protein
MLFIGFTDISLSGKELSDIITLPYVFAMKLIINTKKKYYSSLLE